MTAGMPDNRADLFVAEFYPGLGEYLAEGHATGYDAVAGRTRFLLWLARHVARDAAHEDAAAGDAPDDGDAEAGTDPRAQLVEANRHLVVSMAERFRDRDADVRDLIEAGNRGLARAAEKYDPAKGYLFEAYATWFVRAAITRAAKSRRDRNEKDGAKNV
jgi:DNA-directed RNA polymerase sigma subunit (sigma70/sigma32)